MLLPDGKKHARIHMISLWLKILSFKKSTGFEWESRSAHLRGVFTVCREITNLSLCQHLDLRLDMREINLTWPSGLDRFDHCIAHLSTASRFGSKGGQI